MRGQLKQLGLLVGVVSGSALFLASPVGAASVDWTSSEPQYDGVVDAPVDKPVCEQRNVMIDGLNRYTNGPLEASICYRDRGAWGYGRYSYYQNVFDHGRGDAIRFGLGGVMSQVTTDLTSNGYARLIDVPNSDDVLRTHLDKLWYYRNFPSKFQRVFDTSSVTKYSFDRDDFDFHLSRPDGTDIEIRGLALSNNGKWAALEARGIGLIRVDLKTFAVKRFSAINLNYSNSNWPSPTARMAVSNDGRHAVIAGWNASYNRIFKVTDSCGDEITDQISTKTPVQQECASRDLRQFVVANHPIRHEFIDRPQFSDDGGRLTVQLSGTSGGPLSEWIQLTAGDYIPDQKLSYLALGDSYSSGEGDTEKIGNSKAKWYREWTDVKGSKVKPEERCHVSKRSYPYKLAAGMNMNLDSDWQTVACSGAAAWDVKASGGEGYTGQNDRLQGHNAVSRKAIALNEFIPGRVKQIEFVKKYKPSVITLTMGGNDVGFGDKINKCVRSPRTCEIAKEDMRPKLKKEILMQFDNLSSLYKDLATASNYKSKIYVLGYPQFISGKENVSCDGIFFLRPNERKMIYESVRYINRIIKAASISAGVAYVDTQEALGDKKICEGKDLYATAVTGIWGYNGNQVQESFHPNAKGHQAIANTVVEKLGTNDLLTHTVCSNGREECRDSSITLDDIDDTDYFTVEPATANIQNVKMTEKNHQKSGWVSVVLGAFSFASKTIVGITLHSDPIDLGSFTTNADGSLNTTVQIPAGIEVGYHRIVVTGKTPSGEDIEYYQYVFVQGDNPEDLNDNGIKDSGETCGFLFPDTEYSDNSGLREECELAKKEPPRTGRKLDASKASPWSPGSGTPVFARPASYSELRTTNNPGETILTVNVDKVTDTAKDSKKQTLSSPEDQSIGREQRSFELPKRAVYAVVALTVIIFVSTGVVVYKWIRSK